MSIITQYVHCGVPYCSLIPLPLFFFFFNDTATTEIYTLSLHDALPISRRKRSQEKEPRASSASRTVKVCGSAPQGKMRDRKSTRLNSSHQIISYAVFCLKKKIKSTVATGSVVTNPPSPGGVSWRNEPSV